MVKLPIRLRLTLWYVLLMGLTFAAFGIFLHTRFQHSLMETHDASLQRIVTQTLASFDLEEDFTENGRLFFELNQPITGVALRMISVDGTVWDTYGEPSIWGEGDLTPGYTTLGTWRILTQPILTADGTQLGWLQASQTLDRVNITLADFRAQLFWGIPLVLILAGAGGYFLANRALSPITRITETAHEITAHDLSRRLAYPGPTDEIGQLAQTFDEMLARLQSAFQREHQFTSDAAHELRTPLTTLKGQIEVTLSRPRPPEEYEMKLRDLGVQVDRLIRLTNALLFLSRADQGQHAWDPTLLNLTELLDVIAEQIHPLAQDKAIILDIALPPELPVEGDPDHLTRLFLNLFDNAVKYTPRGGQITLRASRTPAGVEITLHNTGPGIASEHLPHLFERFYRIEADRSRETGGDGLGLAIVQEIV
ncbi:MAG TPA: ATP-binding protein, partial [Anaerolineales bacterium]|nr:ATP-binding protein [Anaerolineales bacterium]